MEYETHKLSLDNTRYELTATQTKRDGMLEGGYVYCISYDQHIIATGHMACFKFSDGLPDGELERLLETRARIHKEES